MKLLCKCGNVFDFSTGDGSMDDGFEIAYVDEEDSLYIHCNNCGNTIHMFDPICIDNEEETSND